MNPANVAIATKAIHGKELYAFRGPVAPPIVQTSTYRFADSSDAIRYAQGDPDVFVYTRYHNPTVEQVQERLSLMMGSERSLLFSSGMAAVTTAILSVVKAGDHIISTPSLYGGTYRFFRDILPRHGVTVSYVAPDRLGDLPRLTTKKTRIVYFETPTNPVLDIVDIEDLVSRARAAERRIGKRIVIMADNTFATILNQNPFQYGVDVLLESCTKYLGGHSDLVAGIVAGTDRFIRDVHTQLKYYGGCADPFAAFLLLRSLKTFTLRVEKQNSNAFTLARYLESLPRVKRVLYPGLPSHPHHAIAAKQMVGAGGNGFGGMLTIEVRGGARAAAKLCNSLCVAVNAMSLGGAETLVSIPVYSSHVHMSREELAQHGVTPGMVRISVGVEDIADLKHDFNQAISRL
ncbi:MAG: aminotransferase class I/II-fold pyridoxal phosphate-dependent enzyme [Bacteroidota bacterium]